MFCNETKQKIRQFTEEEFKIQEVENRKLQFLESSFGYYG